MMLMFVLGSIELSFTSNLVLVVFEISFFLFSIKFGNETWDKVYNIIDNSFRGKVYL